MKKILMIGLVSLAGVGAYAQGTLIFYNSFGDDVFQVYAPNPAAPSVSQEGFTAAQAATINAGGSFTASPVITFGGQVIGGSTSSGSVPATLGVSSPYYSDGNLFTAQIYALSAGNGSGSIPAFSSLLPVSQYIENFSGSGGSANAFLAEATLTTDPGVPGTGYDGSGLHGPSHVLNNAFVGMAAWYNAGGLYTTLAEAQAAGAPWGESQVSLLNNLGEPASVNTSANVNSHQPSTPTEPYGINSFSLATTPEPSTIALGVMGVGAFLARRRKK